ncbi:MAG: alpha/beta hydrolase [Alphaproteobacteria bacterium]|nr:alpha/beta hydrolase [Alphaproteobacteria bacterium]
MTVHPQVAKVLEGAGRVPFGQLPVAELRTAYEAARLPLQPPRPAVASVAERIVDGPGGPLPIRVYRPAAPAPGPLPVLVYLHGGGWVLGTLEGYETLCRILANGAGAIVVSVGYRLAPEHRFPAALEDTLAALDWVQAEAAALGADPTRVALGGDSAGGNLTAAAALVVRDTGRPPLALQVLIYPAVDLAEEWPSMAENAEGYLLTRAGMRWFVAQYLADDGQRLDPRASPLRAASHAGLAPAFVLTAEYDPLRDEGNAYAARLAAAGVPVEHVCWPGMVHPFVSMGGVIDAAAAAQARICDALRRAFGAE